MNQPNTIAQAEKTLGSISHLRIRRGAEKTECIFELDSQAASAVDTSVPCTIYDGSGQPHVVELVKVFFSQWAFRSIGSVVASGCTDANWDEKS